MTMFVVRIELYEEEPDHKAFMHQQDARNRFDHGRGQTYDNEFQSIAIFEVPDTDDPGKAVEAVKRGDPTEVRLVDKVDLSSLLDDEDKKEKK